MSSHPYEPRFYRRAVAPEGLVCFEAVVAETDLQVAAERDLTAQTLDLIREARAELERYIATHPRFASSLVPLPVDESAPGIVRRMAEAAEAAGVGPMAAVAGAVAEQVARGLAAAGSHEVIVENGGDVYLMGARARVLALWAGEAGAQGVGIEIPGDALPLAVATSSGRIGPSLSFGSADAVAVLARSGALADAVASTIANRIRAAGDIPAALEAGRAVPGVLGAVATVDGALGAFGDVRLVPVDIG